MSKFLKRIALFIFPLFIIIPALDALISYSLKQRKPVNEIEVWDDIYDGKIDCEMAIYGSSRAWYHIDPEIIEDSLNLTAYNLGIDGHNFWLQYLRHIEYLRKNHKPKIILHSIDVFTLEKGVDLFNLEQFLPFMLWNKNIRQYTSSYNGYSTLDYFVPLVRFSKAPTILLLSEKPEFNRNKGFKGTQQIWGNDLEKARSVKEKYLATIDTATFNLYKAFLKECSSDEIEVILVYTPEHIEGQEYVVNREEIINTFKQLAEEYNLLFLDYSNNEMCFDKKYFYNASHLNAYGADLFTRILTKDLKDSEKLKGLF